MNKIKHKQKKPRRYPTAVTVVKRKLRDHADNVPMVFGYVDPPLTHDEQRQFAFLSQEIFKQLETKYGARAKMLVPVFMYRACLEGIIAALEESAGESIPADVKLTSIQHHKAPHEPGPIPTGAYGDGGEPDND